jgi:hypothetical protein
LAVRAGLHIKFWPTAQFQISILYSFSEMI